MRSDYDGILSALKRSSFRSRFSLAPRYRRYVEEKGLDAIRGHAVALITARIAPADPPNDGRQTPMKNHPVFIAQHGTGTCCRGCLEKWHGMEKGRALTAGEVDFIVELIMRWIAAEVLPEKASSAVSGPADTGAVPLDPSNS